MQNIFISGGRLRAYINPWSSIKMVVDFWNCFVVMLQGDFFLSLAVCSSQLRSGFASQDIQAYSWRFPYFFEEMTQGVSWDLSASSRSPHPGYLGPGILWLILMIPMLIALCMDSKGRAVHYKLCLRKVDSACLDPVNSWEHWGPLLEAPFGRPCWHRDLLLEFQESVPAIPSGLLISNPL